MNQSLFKKKNRTGHAERDLALFSRMPSPERLMMALSCLEAAWPLRRQISVFMGVGVGSDTLSPSPYIEASDGEPAPETTDRDPGKGEECGPQPGAPTPAGPKQDPAARGPASPLPGPHPEPVAPHREPH